MVARRPRRGAYSLTMPERKRRPDLDERFSLYPMEGEEALERLLEGPGTTTNRGHDEGDEVPEDESEEL